MGAPLDAYGSGRVCGDGYGQSLRRRADIDGEIQQERTPRDSTVTIGNSEGAVVYQANWKSGTGTRSFRIGAVSLMPVNNVQGFRAEVIAALKQLHSAVYCWRRSLPESGVAILQPDPLLHVKMQIGISDQL